MSLTTLNSLQVTSYTGPLREPRTDKKSYRPNCVLLLPRQLSNKSSATPSPRAEYVPDPRARNTQERSPRKRNSGGVRKAVLNKRREEPVKRKPKARRKLPLPRQCPSRTPLSLALFSLPNNGMQCDLEFDLSQVFHDPDDARAIIAEYLRGDAEHKRQEPSGDTYRSIYGELYGRHLEHMRRKSQMDGEETAGVGKKTALHIHQHCSCASHDVKTE